MDLGNTFDTTTVTYGHARKVWREIRHQYPAGGTISNVSAWSSAGKIPSGTPCKYDAANKTITAYPDATVSGAADAAAVVALGINGYLQEDVVIKSNSTVGTGTVIYAGEIYEYMFASAVLEKLKLNTLTPMIVFVQ